MIYDNLTELIGGTPLIRLGAFRRNGNLKGNILAKVEFFNPASSVKDRAAYFMIKDAEEKGLIKKGGVIVEPTSGNTGIGLAWISAIRGYRLILTMPETASEERIKLARFFGAEVVLTPAAEGMGGAVRKAEEIAGENGGFIPDQFANPANAYAHYRTTAEEIISDTEGKVDYFVSAFGSGGTLTGTGKRLKEVLPDVKIIAVEPARSPLLSQGKSGPHKIQGIGANFIPEVLDRTLIDEVIVCTDEDAFAYSSALAKEEGLLCGISSGAALFAAAKIASKEEAAGKNIVVILPDTGERYLSTDLFKL